MSAFANPVFPRIDPTSNPAGSALNRVSRLDYALTKNAPATPLESALTKLLDLKSFRFRSYKKHRGGPPSLGSMLPCLPASLSQPRRRSLTRWRKQIGVPRRGELAGGDPELRLLAFRLHCG